MLFDTTTFRIAETQYNFPEHLQELNNLARNAQIYGKKNSNLFYMTTPSINQLQEWTNTPNLDNLCKKLGEIFISDCLQTIPKNQQKTYLTNISALWATQQACTLQWTATAKYQVNILTKEAYWLSLPENLRITMDNIKIPDIGTLSRIPLWIKGEIMQYTNPGIVLTTLLPKIPTITQIQEALNHIIVPPENNKAATSLRKWIHEIKATSQPCTTPQSLWFQLLTDTPIPQSTKIEQIAQNTLDPSYTAEFIYFWGKRILKGIARRKIIEGYLSNFEYNIQAIIQNATTTNAEIDAKTICRAANIQMENSLLALHIATTISWHGLRLVELQQNNKKNEV